MEQQKQVVRQVMVIPKYCCRTLNPVFIIVDIVQNNSYSILYFIKYFVLTLLSLFLKTFGGKDGVGSCFFSFLWNNNKSLYRFSTV